ncbi:MAG: peptidoglycan-binding domain-containing protein [Ilumatobacteraceae bacterium]
MLDYIGAGATASTGPTPGIERWKEYVLGRWPGGMDLGTWIVRNVRGGDTLSVHAVGRAWDWRYASPGPGRAAAEEAMAFTIEHHELLGIQAIHDYVACRIWRSSRPGSGPAWKQQRPGNGMGEAWAQWLHFEVHPTSRLHELSVVDVLNENGVAADAVESVPTAALPLPTLRMDDHGPGVAHLQQVLEFWNYYTARVDGEFGAKTAAAVTAWQVALQPWNVGRPDGVYGPRTHAAAAISYATLERLAA